MKWPEQWINMNVPGHIGLIRYGEALTWTRGGINTWTVSNACSPCFSSFDWHLIFSFVPITALIVAAVTLGNSIAARTQARRALAIHLREFYQSADFYAKVRATVY